MIDAGESVSAFTLGYADTIVGPVIVDGIAFSLVIPAVALPEGQFIEMTPVTFEDAPFTAFGAFRFAPDGLEFRVPATLVAEGLPDTPIAVGSTEDDGTGTTLTFAPSADGIARAPVEHFSVASIVDAASTQAAIRAAGLAHVPESILAAVPPLANAFVQTVQPAIENANASLASLTIAARLLAEWGAAFQARNTTLETSPLLGGRTFQQTFSDAQAELGEEGAEVLEDLQRPVCHDGTGQLSHPLDWIHAFGHAIQIVRDVASNLAPTSYAPCITLAFPLHITSYGQGGSIARDQQFAEVFVALDGISPTGERAPVVGTYTVAASGTLAETQSPAVPVNATSPANTPVAFDRGTDCAARGDLSFTITAGLPGLFGVANILLDPITTTFSKGSFGACPCEPPECIPPTVSLTGHFGEMEALGRVDHRPTSNDSTISTVHFDDDDAGGPLAGAVSGSAAYSADVEGAPMSGSFSALANVSTDQVTLDALGNVTGGSFTANVRCTHDIGAQVTTCNGLPNGTACGTAIARGSIDHSVSFTSHVASRFVASGSVTTDGTIDPLQQSFARVNAGGLVTEHGSGNFDDPETFPISVDTELAAGETTGVSVELSAFCSDIPVFGLTEQDFVGSVTVTWTVSPL
jgi:hypothetical protein